MMTTAPISLSARQYPVLHMPVVTSNVNGSSRVVKRSATNPSTAATKAVPSVLHLAAMKAARMPCVK